MSRTDKTAPIWVIEQRYGVLHHDHRFGECVEDTPEHARAAAHSRRWHHRRDCGRWTAVRTVCPGHLVCKDAADKLRFLLATRMFFSDLRRALQPTGTYLNQYDADSPYRCDRGHISWTYDETAQCGYCDNLGSTPTCVRHIDGSYVRVAGRYFGDGPDHEFRRKFETVARARTRTALRNAARDYNANGDTDIEVEPSRHRHNARYYWW